MVQSQGCNGSKHLFWITIYWLCYANGSAPPSGYLWLKSSFPPYFPQNVLDVWGRFLVIALVNARVESCKSSNTSLSPLFHLHTLPPPPLLPQISTNTYLLHLTSPLPRPHLIPLPINLPRKRILVPQRNPIRHGHQHAKHQPSRPPVPQRRPRETRRAAPVHWRVGHAEREALDARRHEDAEVVAEVGARHAEGVHGGEDEGVASGEEEEGERGGEGGGEEGWGGGLGEEGAVVAVILCV